MEILKVGDRVNVVFNVTKEWESEAGVSNAVVKKIHKDSVEVECDSLSIDFAFKRRLTSGRYSDAYTITKL